MHSTPQQVNNTKAGAETSKQSLLSVSDYQDKQIHHAVAAATGGADENYGGNYIHGTDVSASYSSKPMNQLDSYSDCKLQNSTHGRGGQLGQAIELDRMQLLTTNVQAKDQGEDMLIVGGGEIDLMESEDDGVEDSP